MEPLYIKEARDTPGVVMDKDANRFEIYGRSFPGDVEQFFSTVIEWLQQYSNNPNPQTVVSFKMDYFNSGTSKVFTNVFRILNEIAESGNVVEIKWYHHMEDEDMEEAGKDFELVVPLKFEYIPY